MSLLEFKLRETRRKPADYNPDVTHIYFRGEPQNEAAQVLCDSKGGVPKAEVACSNELADDPTAEAFVSQMAIDRISELLDQATEDEYVIA